MTSMRGKALVNGRKMVHQLNQLRTNPKSFVPDLQLFINKFETSHFIKYDNNTIVKSIQPKQNWEISLQQLKNVNPISYLQYNQLLSLAAFDHMQQIFNHNIKDHWSVKGESLQQRLKKRLNWFQDVGECLIFDFRYNSQRQSILKWFVDDGVPDRSNRRIMISSKYKHVGSVYLNYPQKQSCCGILIVGGQL